MAMRLDLTDEETFALLNLLVDTIEPDRYPMSPRIVLARDPHQVRRGGRTSAGTRCAAPPLCTSAASATANRRGA